MVCCLWWLLLFLKILTFWSSLLLQMSLWGFHGWNLNSAVNTFDPGEIRKDHISIYINVWFQLFRRFLLLFLVGCSRIWAFSRVTHAIFIFFYQTRFGLIESHQPFDNCVSFTTSFITRQDQRKILVVDWLLIFLLLTVLLNAELFLNPILTSISEGCLILCCFLRRWRINELVKGSQSLFVSNQILLFIILAVLLLDKVEVGCDQVESRRLWTIPWLLLAISIISFSIIVVSIFYSSK